MVKADFESKWAKIAARIVIAVAAGGLLLLIRPDIYGYLSERVRTHYQELISSRIIEEYLQNTPKPKVQVGAGRSDAVGWLNTDFEPHAGEAYVDIAKPLPFRDSSIYYIFGEHVIEHVNYDEALRFFKEAHRILTPGGVIRVVTPNLRKLVALLDEAPVGKSASIAEYIPRKLEIHGWAKTPDPGCFILNNEMHSFGHRFLYTPEMLRATLEQAGFTNIRQYAPGETTDPEFKAVEVRYRNEWKDVNAYEAMAFEATR